MPIALETISNDVLQPELRADSVVRLACSLFANSLTLAKGTVLGRRTSDGKLAAYTPINHIQTVTIAGTLSGGTFRITGTTPTGTHVTTDAIAFNANAAAIQTALNAVLGASAVVVAGTVASFTVTFSGTGYTLLDQPLLRVNVGATTGATTVTVADTTTLTGLEVARGILSVAIVTDASGNIYLGDSANGGTVNPPVASVPVVIGGGIWNTSQFVGWDAGARTDLGGRTLLTNRIALPAY